MVGWTPAIAKERPRGPRTLSAAGGDGTAFEPRCGRKRRGGGCRAGKRGDESGRTGRTGGSDEAVDSRLEPRRGELPGLATDRAGSWNLVKGSGRR